MNSAVKILPYLCLLLGLGSIGAVVAASANTNSITHESPTPTISAQ